MIDYKIDKNVKQIPLSQLNYAIENGFIKPDTLYFDNTVLTKITLENNWINACKNTWLGGKFESLGK